MNNCCPLRWQQLFWIFAILLFPAQSMVFAQDYRFDRWEAKDGLAQNTVKIILQSQDGYLWLSTEGGLSRFDGVSFTNFGLSSSPEFKSERIGTIFENDNGDILFWNYLAGFMVYHDHEFYNISSTISTDDKRIRYFLKCSKDYLLLVNYNSEMSLISITDYSEVKIDGFDFTEIPLNVFCYGDYNVWVYKDRICFKGNDLKPIPNKPTIMFENHISQAEQDLETGYYWVFDKAFFYKYRDNELIDKYPITKELKNQDVQTMHPSNGKLFLNNSGTSLIYYLNETTEQYHIYSKQQDVCPEGQIFQTFIDRENNVWFATSTCGLVKIKPPRISYLDKDEWNLRKNYYPIVKDQNDAFYLGGSNSGLIKIDSLGNLVDVPAFDALKDLTINSIELHNDAIYFITYLTNYIYKYEDGKCEIKYFPDTTAVQKNAIYSTPSGRLIVGDLYGYFELVDDEFVSRKIIDDRFIFISSFLETTDSVLWISSSNMLIAYDQKQEKVVYDSRETIPEVNNFREITEDEDGRIFVGTYGHGFLWIEKNKTTLVSIQNGLNENVVSTITEDAYGNIWLTGNKGLTRLIKRNVLKFVNGEVKTLSPVVYNEQTDGLRTSEFNGGHQHSKCHLHDDCYIFPTMNGAVIVDFAKMQETESPPPVLIEKFVYNNQHFYPDSSFETNYTADRLDIYYTSTSFISPKQIAFKYKLEGFDNDWNDVGGERKASYAKLPPGNYTFLVKAQNHEGVWNEEAAQLSFRIIPPFYKTMWFNIVLIILTIGITALIVNAFNQMKRKRSSARQMLQLEAIVSTEEKERKRIAADLHDGIGQLLSVIKINLGIAKDKILQDQSTDSIELVDNSQKAIEGVMSEIRNISYNLLPPSLEQFGLTMAISEEVSKLKDDPNLHVHFNHDLRDVKFDSKIEIILYRVFQELLNNAIKHSEATEITIQLIQHEDSLMLMMEDDGNGFNLPEAYGKMDSSGLKNIFSRVKSIKGKINIDSQPGAGANTIVEIPLKK